MRYALAVLVFALGCWDAPTEAPALPKSRADWMTLWEGEVMYTVLGTREDTTTGLTVVVLQHPYLKESSTAFAFPQAVTPAVGTFIKKVGMMPTTGSRAGVEMVFINSS